MLFFLISSANINFGSCDRVFAILILPSCTCSFSCGNLVPIATLPFNLNTLVPSVINASSLDVWTFSIDVWISSLEVWNIIGFPLKYNAVLKLIEPSTSKL